MCQLLGSMYGLKQFLRQWYIRFHNTIMAYDFVMISEDNCVYIKRPKNQFVILLLYVDNILIAESSVEFVKIVKNWLSSSFKMKYMGKAAYILGVKILKDRSKKSLYLSQETYVNKILKRFYIQDCKSLDTPIVKSEVLSDKVCLKTLQEKEQMEHVPFASANGSLIYAMMCTKPNIC